jgi:hypothetical protein
MGELQGTRPNRGAGALGDGVRQTRLRACAEPGATQGGSRTGIDLRGRTRIDLVRPAAVTPFRDTGLLVVAVVAQTQ